MRIIKSEVDKIKFSDKKKENFYWDDDLKGFGIKTTATSKTYIIQGRINRKTVRRKIGNVGTLTPDEARKESIKLLAELAKGVDINAEKKKEQAQGVTLKQAFEDYKHIKNLRESTKAGYNCAFNTVFKDWLDVEIKKINRDMVDNKFKTYSKQAPISANLYFRVLKAVFNFAIEKYCIDGEPIIPSNPCDRLKVFGMWNKMQPRDRYIKPAQIKIFFYAVTPDEADTPYTRAVKNQCKLLLFTGLRDQEAASLRKKDIDFDDKTITVENTKNHHRHVLPFGEWLGEFLSKLCEGKKQNDFIFATGSKYGHLKDHRKAVKQISDDCGVAFSLHDLRRTFASIVANNLPFVVSGYYQQRLLNHIPQDVHSKYYIQFDTGALRKPMQAVEDFILTRAGIKEPEKKAENVINFEDFKKVR